MSSSMEDLESETDFELVVGETEQGLRLDKFLATHFDHISRTLFRKAIEEGLVVVNDQPARASVKLEIEDRVAGSFPQPAISELLPEPMDLRIIHEDEFLVVIDKPADLIVHPGKGNYSGTLANGLQHHFDRLSDVGGTHRPGIVHRLDRDTSGVIVVAKTNAIHDRLSRQFADRTVEKTYYALIWGTPAFDRDYIETHIKPSVRHREKMQVCHPGNRSRSACTFYEVRERFEEFSLVKLTPKTGRTHQLRVHMQHIKHPIVADRVYGGQDELRVSQVEKTVAPGQPEDRVLINRQALHAGRLSFTHPESGQRMSFDSPLAPDIQSALDQMRMSQKRTRR